MIYLRPKILAGIGAAYQRENRAANKRPSFRQSYLPGI